MSDTTGPDGNPDINKDPNACWEQKQRTRVVERELKKLSNRLERDKIAHVFHLQVFAFNCDDRKHKEPDAFHMDYVAGTGHGEIPDSLYVTIRALEHALAELKKKVQ